MKAATFVAGLLAAAALSSVACNKIPSLSKGNGGDEGGASASSGATGLSFLGAPFEGELTMNVVNTSGQKPQPMTIVVGNKSPKVRVDITSTGQTPSPMLQGGGALLIDPPAKKGYLLMPPQKRAMVLDFEQMKAQQATLKNAGAKNGVPVPDEGPPQIEKTGKTDVVAGYTCENWKMTTKTMHADMCVADGLKILDLTDLGLGAPELALAAAAGNLNHFPLKVVTFNAQNVEQTRMEVTKVDRKTMDAARFVVPPDYQVMDLSAMMGGMGMGGMGAPGGPGKLPPGVPPGFTTPPPSKAH